MTACLCLLVFLSACSAFHEPAPKLPDRADVKKGETITVKGAQNIYGVARSYHVSMREVIVLNNLQPPFALRAGQKLVLPAEAHEDGDGQNAPSPTAAPMASIEKVELAPVAPPPSSDTKQKVGAVVAAEPVLALGAPVAPPKPVATTVTSEVKAETAGVKPSMSWPVQGPILSGFGAKGQGLNNDGINIGAPKGAPVVAASAGIVVYAGNEMKGFGNLVLIRHQGGWVTAYAHLDRMLVAKDAVVAQGDMIGTVGKTGNVPSPQLHFETRFEGKVVDPASVMVKGL